MKMQTPPIVSAQDWQTEHMRAGDALAAQRRRMPWMAVEKQYVFDSPDGKVSLLDDFDRDFGVDEWPGTIAFIRDGGRVFKTYLVNNRGDEAFVTTWSLLEETALGRQEEWEDSPEGYPQSPPYEWWDWHAD